MKAVVLYKPALHFGVFVRAVVVGDDVDLLAGRCLSIDEAEKRNPIFVCMPVTALAEDSTIQRVQRGEQCRRSMPLIVVRHGFSPTFLHGQAWLGAVKCLDLALL